MKKLLPLAALTLSLYSCSKSNSSTDPGKNDSMPEVAVPVDVYVGCTIGKVDSSQAGYWKNGTLDTVSEKHYAWYAQSVIPVGSDVYVLGGEYNTAGYWKNGVFTGLLSADQYAAAVGMAFIGTDRYEVCVGYYSSGPAGGGLFKNDQLQMAGFYGGIVVSGNDVYLYGSTSYNNHAAAAIWKNGILQQLDQGANPSYVNGLAVSGTNTFVCGYEMDPAGHAIAHYWKNGVDSLLSDASGITVPNHIAVSSGGNVYMCGYTQSGTFNMPGPDAKQLFWKNGYPGRLERSSSRIQCGRPRGERTGRLYGPCPPNHRSRSESNALMEKWRDDKNRRGSAKYQCAPFDPRTEINQ